MEGPVKRVELRLIFEFRKVCCVILAHGVWGGCQDVGDGRTTVDQTDIRGSKPHDLIRRGSA
jgi:hypothetical protein